MRNRRYRRIKPTSNCQPQGYQLSLIAFMVTFGLTGLILFISKIITVMSSYLVKPLIYSIAVTIIAFLLLLYTWFQREEVSSIEIPPMSNKSQKLAPRCKMKCNKKDMLFCYTRIPQLSIESR